MIIIEVVWRFSWAGIEKRTELLLTLAFEIKYPNERIINHLHR
jgi:hypothetical protein